MKHLKIEAEYVVKSDIIKMLRNFLTEFEKSDGLVMYEAESNVGSKLDVEIIIEELEDLREKIDLP